MGGFRGYDLVRASPGLLASISAYTDLLPGRRLFARRRRLDAFYAEVRRLAFR